MSDFFIRSNKFCPIARFYLRSRVIFFNYYIGKRFSRLHLSKKIRENTMQKVTIETIKDKKRVSVYVDEEIARWLETADEQTRNEFVLYEKQAAYTERNETRRHISLNYIVENGFDVAEDLLSADEILESNERKTAIKNAMEILEPQQKIFVKQMYYEQKTVSELAQIYAVNNSEIESRKKKILKKMKKFLEKGLNFCDSRGL